MNANQFTPPLKRIYSNIIIDTMTYCWVWQGYFSINKRGDKRPRMNFNGKPERVYRVIYSLLIGKIPKGKLVCHKCDNSMCVNPDHLFIGTHKDNHQDSLRKGRHSTQKYPDLFKELGRKMALKRIANQALAKAS